MSGDVARALTPAADAAAPKRRLPSFERTLSAVELVAIVGLQFTVVWSGIWLLTLPGFIPVAAVAFSAEIIYIVYLSPVWLHRDPLPERGLGTWWTLFVRTDNLGAASWGFGWLALAGTVAIVILAAFWNPGWTTRISWPALATRLRLYLISAVVQALALVGFGLPRFRSLLMPVATPGQDAASDTLPRRLLVSVVVALVFGGLHAPHPLLIALAAVFGFALAWLSLRTPNVLATACCQFLLGLQVHFVLGLTMRVGIFHSHPDVRFLRDIFAWIDLAVGGFR
jgi:hypothetical protein